MYFLKGATRLFLVGGICAILSSRLIAGENRWTPAGPPDRILSLTKDGGDPGSLYALTAAGVYRSDDLGENWSLVNSVITSSVARHLLAHPKGFGVVNAVGCGAFQSTNAGVDWSRIDQGLPIDCSFSTLGIDPANSWSPFRPYDLFVGGASGFYRTDFNTSGPFWTPIAQGILTGPAALAAASVSGVIPSRVFVAPVEGGFLYTDDRGKTWNTRSAPSGIRINSLATLGTTQGNSFVVAATDQGLQETRDAGRTWKPTGGPLAGVSVSSVLLSDGFANYAATDSGLYRNTGAGWASFSDGLPEGLPLLHVFSDRAGRHLYASSVSGDQSFVYRYGNPTIVAQIPVQTVFVDRYLSLPFTISPAQPGDFTLEWETSDPSVVQIVSGGGVEIHTLRATGTPVTIRARVPAEFGGSEASWQVTVVNPPSTAKALFPTAIAAGSQGLTLRVYDADSGFSFIAGSTIYWNGSPRTSTKEYAPCAMICAYSQWLEADIDAADLAAPGFATITVVNPPPGGGTSRALTFTIGPGAARAPVVREERPPRQPRLGGPRN